jgi:hypothetical protein
MEIDFEECELVNMISCKVRLCSELVFDNLPKNRSIVYKDGCYYFYCSKTHVTIYRGFLRNSEKPDSNTLYIRYEEAENLIDVTSEYQVYIRKTKIGNILND